MDARTGLAALLLVPSLALGACGQASKDSSGDFKGDQKAVAQAVEDLQDAGTKRDAKKICDELLTPELVAQITKASKGKCQDVLKDALADADSFELQVEKVTITGDQAVAQVTSSGGSQDRRDTLRLQRLGRAWKISALAGS